MDCLYIRRPNGDAPIRVPFEEKITIAEVKQLLHGPAKLQRIVMGVEVLEDDYVLTRSDLPAELLLVISGAAEEFCCAAARGDTPMLKAVLELHRGDRPRILQAEDSRGRTALILAVCSGSREEMRLLLETSSEEEVGAMLQECDEDDNGALHAAAARDDDVFIQDAMQALGRKSCKTQEEVAYLLSAKNDQGQMPFDVAMANSAPSAALQLFRRSTEPVRLCNVRTVANFSPEKLPQRKGKVGYAQPRKLSQQFSMLLRTAKTWARSYNAACAEREEMDKVVSSLIKLEAVQEHYHTELTNPEWANIEDSQKADLCNPWFANKIAEKVHYLYKHGVKPVDYLVRRLMEGFFEDKTTWKEDLRHACLRTRLCVVQVDNSSLVLFNGKHGDRLSDYFVDPKADTVEWRRGVVEDIRLALPEMEEMEPSSHFVVAQYMFNKFKHSEQHERLRIGSYMQLLHRMMAANILGWQRAKADQMGGNEARRGKKTARLVPYDRSDDYQKALCGTPIKCLQSEDGRATQARVFTLLLAHGGRLALTRLKTEYLSMFGTSLREDAFGSPGESRHFGQLSQLIGEMRDVCAVSSREGDRHTSYATVFTEAFERVLAEKLTDSARTSGRASLVGMTGLLVELIDEQKSWFPAARLCECEDAKHVFRDRICALPTGLATVKRLLMADEMRELREKNRPWGDADLDGGDGSATPASSDG